MNRRMILILGLILLGFLFLGRLFTEKDYATNNNSQLILNDVHPLAWLDNKVMLVARNNEILTYDLSSKSFGEAISKYFPSSEECFSPEGGIFAVSVQKDNPTFATKFKVVNNWYELSDSEERPRVEWWQINYSDCSLLPRNYDKENTKRLDMEGEIFVEDSYSMNLLKEKHTDVYSGRLHNTIVVISKDSQEKIVKLGTFDFGDQGLTSAYDKNTDSYLWYPSHLAFSSYDGDWPSKAFWVSPNGDIQREVILPVGPWVKSYFGSGLRYFSCGVDCYTGMKLYVANKNIYIKIDGEAVSKQDKGVYLLQDRSWIKIISGNLDKKISISPDGCAIAYSVNKQFFIHNICM